MKNAIIYVYKLAPVFVIFLIQTSQTIDSTQTSDDTSVHHREAWRLWQLIRDIWAPKSKTTSSGSIGRRTQDEVTVSARKECDTVQEAGEIEKCLRKTNSGSTDSTTKVFTQPSSQAEIKDELRLRSSNKILTIPSSNSPRSTQISHEKSSKYNKFWTTWNLLRDAWEPVSKSNSSGARSVERRTSPTPADIVVSVWTAFKEVKKAGGIEKFLAVNHADMPDSMREMFRKLCDQPKNNDTLRMRPSNEKVAVLPPTTTTQSNLTFGKSTKAIWRSLDYLKKLVEDKWNTKRTSSMRRRTAPSPEEIVLSAWKAFNEVKKAGGIHRFLAENHANMSDSMKNIFRKLSQQPEMRNKISSRLRSNKNTVLPTTPIPQHQQTFGYKGKTFWRSWNSMKTLLEDKWKTNSTSSIRSRTAPSPEEIVLSAWKAFSEVKKAGGIDRFLAENHGDMSDSMREMFIKLSQHSEMGNKISNRSRSKKNIVTNIQSTSPTLRGHKRKTFWKSWDTLKKLLEDKRKANSTAGTSIRSRTAPSPEEIVLSAWKAFSEVKKAGGIHRFLAENHDDMSDSMREMFIKLSQQSEVQDKISTRSLSKKNTIIPHKLTSQSHQTFGDNGKTFWKSWGYLKNILEANSETTNRTTPPTAEEIVLAAWKAFHEVKKAGGIENFLLGNHADMSDSMKETIRKLSDQFEEEGRMRMRSSSTIKTVLTSTPTIQSHDTSSGKGKAFWRSWDSLMKMLEPKTNTNWSASMGGITAPNSEKIVVSAWMAFNEVKKAGGMAKFLMENHGEIPNSMKEMFRKLSKQSEVEDKIRMRSLDKINFKTVEKPSNTTTTTTSAQSKFEDLPVQSWQNDTTAEKDAGLNKMTFAEGISSKDWLNRFLYTLQTNQNYMVAQASREDLILDLFHVYKTVERAGGVERVVHELDQALPFTLLKIFQKIISDSREDLKQR